LILDYNRCLITSGAVKLQKTKRVMTLRPLYYSS
jgi:hypothetical protein